MRRVTLADDVPVRFDVVGDTLAGFGAVWERLEAHGG
jgi:hypothetical protein